MMRREGTSGVERNGSREVKRQTERKTTGGKLSFDASVVLEET